MNKSVLIIVIIITIGIILFNFLSKSGGNGNMSQWKQQIDEEPGIIIDVRTQNEFNQGHLANVDLHYDFNGGEFEDKVDELDKEKTYYLYCRTGNRSGQAAEIMKSRGFKNVHNIGGFNDLANSGFDTE